jgi:predicted nuclease with TOPRIM domain
MSEEITDMDSDWTGAWNEWEKFHREVKEKFNVLQAEKDRLLAEKVKLLAENADLRKALREELASTQDATCELATIKWRLEDGKLREKLADYAHEAWSEWLTSLLDRSKSVMIPGAGEEVEAGIFIPQEFVTRLIKQIETVYKNLPEVEKKSCLKEADRIMSVSLKFVFDESEEGVKS